MHLTRAHIVEVYGHVNIFFICQSLLNIPTMSNFDIVIAILLWFQFCVAFDLPRDGCQAELKINDNRYNVTDTYHIGNVHPTDAHYDVYGNIFYVETGLNDKGYYFNTNIIKFKTTAPQKIPGESFLNASTYLYLASLVLYSSRKNIIDL